MVFDQPPWWSAVYSSLRNDDNGPKLAALLGAFLLNTYVFLKSACFRKQESK